MQSYYVLLRNHCLDLCCQLAKRKPIILVKHHALTNSIYLFRIQITQNTLRIVNSSGSFSSWLEYFQRCCCILLAFLVIHCVFFIFCFDDLLVITVLGAWRLFFACLFVNVDGFLVHKRQLEKSPKDFTADGLSARYPWLNMQKDFNLLRSSYEF